MPTKLTIIGAGPGGYVAAIRASQKGALTTIIEASEVGGTCLNRGCIPTKTLIASADILKRVRHAGNFGIELACEPFLNLAKIRERRDKVVSTQVKGVRALLKSWGVNLIEARASLLSEDVVRAVNKNGTTMDVKSDRLIIATGSRPARIPGFPFDGDNVLTSDDAVDLKRIPKSILIVGAGVIGCEFAFLFQAFGSEVTMVEMLPRALSTEDVEISGIIERELKKARIKLYLNARVERIEKSSDNVIATLNGEREVRAEQILVSVGRSMNTEGLGLEAIGIETGTRGEIPVNDRMETSTPGVYAIGDVTGINLLAHVASRQGEVAVNNALGGDARMDYSAVPAGIFTNPEIGSVGLREQQALERGMKIRIGRFQYRTLGKAHAMGEITGMVKIIADDESGRVLGVHVCGAHASDLVHEGALAVRHGLQADELGNMIHAHPTLAEAVMEAAEDVHRRAVHIPRQERRAE